MPTKKFGVRCSEFGVFSFIAIIVSAFVFLYPVPYTLYPIHAQTASVSALPSTISTTSPIYTDLLIHNMFHSFSCLSVGSSIIGQPCLTYQFTKNAEGALQSIPMLSQTNLSGGVFGATTSLIGAMYIHHPLSTGEYLASVGEGLGIVKEANAQGVVGAGQSVLSPVLKLWQVSRNISYILLIIIFVVIGIMVMFRNRINPQTVITAQAALPGLIIGLILITFSYFFAALISDFSFVATNLVGYYFQAAQGQQPTQDLVSRGAEENVISIFSRFAGIINKETASDMLSSIWDNLTPDVKGMLTALAAVFNAQITSQGTEFLKAIKTYGQGIQAALIGVSVLFGAANPTAFVGIPLAFIATAVLIYQMFKLLLRLINNFLAIIFLTVTAPFHFLASALPGRQGIATGWVLNMLCNVLAFPAVMMVFYFVAFLLKGVHPDVYYSPFLVSDSASITGTSTFPLFGGLDLKFINILLAFGALAASPSIPDIICRLIGRVGVAGQLIGQELGGGVGQGRQYAGQFQSGVGSTSSQIAQARGLSGTPAYMPTGFDEHGKPIGWMLNPHQYQPSVTEKLQARLIARSGKLKPYKMGE